MPACLCMHSRCRGFDLVNQIAFVPRRNTSAIPFAQQCQSIRFAKREAMDQYGGNVKRGVMPTLTADCRWTLGDVTARPFNDGEHRENLPSLPSIAPAPRNAACRRQMRLYLRP